MTKKDFKEKCRFETYTGTNIKVNAIFFDWKERFGYKYMVKASTRELTKKELFDELYEWVVNKRFFHPYSLDFKLAETDEQRFKVPLSM